MQLSVRQKSVDTVYSLKVYYSTISKLFKIMLKFTSFSQGVKYNIKKYSLHVYKIKFEATGQIKIYFKHCYSEMLEVSV